LSFDLFYAYEGKTKEITMCFGGGPSKAEKEAAAEQRVEADVAKREEVEKRASQKREDISEALESRTTRAGMRGGKGRRSLFRAPSTGFLGRFD
jgi:hypothetical protein